MRYGMVIDQKKCIGCRSCVIACKAENGTPPAVFWTDVLQKEVGVYPTTRRTFMPKLCNHCKEPICKEVCPTGATQKRPDGIVWVDADKCTGCRYCMMACPYEVRFYVDRFSNYFPQGPTPYEKYAYAKHQKGVVQKCSLCKDRLDRGLKPACVEICPTEARVFGDLDDPNSEVTQLLVVKHGVQLLSEVGTDPSVFYLPG